MAYKTCVVYLFARNSYIMIIAMSYHTVTSYIVIYHDTVYDHISKSYIYDQLLSHHTRGQYYRKLGTVV